MTVEYRPCVTFTDFVDALRIRVTVFNIERGMPLGWEPDEYDKNAQQFVAAAGGRVVGTARLREEPRRALKIERMAVLREYRGRGIGRGLTRYVVRSALDQNPERIWLEAQSSVRSFYERVGFHVTSDEYRPWDLEVPHVSMEYRK